MTVRSKIREIFMPALSSTMTEGKIVSWIKTEGEKLAKGESVVVESDKADMDVETFYDGYLAAIVVGEGESDPVGDAIGLLAETKAEIEEAKANVASKSSSSAPEAVVPSPPSVTSSPAPAIAQPAPVTTVPDGPRKTVARPYAKKLAKQHNVDIGLTSQDLRCGSNTPENPSLFLDAEKDFVRRSSEKNPGLTRPFPLLLPPPPSLFPEGLKRALSAAAEMVGGLREEEEDEAAPLLL